MNSLINIWSLLLNVNSDVTIVILNWALLFPRFLAPLSRPPVCLSVEVLWPIYLLCSCRNYHYATIQCRCQICVVQHYNIKVHTELSIVIMYGGACYLAIGSSDLSHNTQGAQGCVTGAMTPKFALGQPLAHPVV